ncbi:MAG: peptidylprolyl isomerase [Hyphomonadaceae bacterium]
MRNLVQFSFAALALCALPAAAQEAQRAPVSPQSDPANWREVSPENLLQLTINGKTVLVELRPDFAPAHVAQIRKIARDGNYDGTPFHRVIDDFMAQGGEVSAAHELVTPYPSLNAEFTFRRNPAVEPVQWVTKGAAPVGYLDGFIVTGQPDAAAMLMADKSVDTMALHCAGVTSMARTDDPNSADSQFFLMRQARAALDGKYTVWGRALTGLDVIRGIKAGPDEADGRLDLANADKLTHAVIVADLPADQRPRAFVQRPGGPNFKTELQAAQNVSLSAACGAPSVPIIVEEPHSD